MDAWIKQTVYNILKENADQYLDHLVNQTREIFCEMEDIQRETEDARILLEELDDDMRWTEDQIETIRRDRNRAAVIVWNFPEDLHPTIGHPSSTPEEKIDAVLEFLTRTVGVSDYDVVFMGVEHAGVFFTNYKSQRSANVRIQFVDEEAKSLCESYCIPFFKMFNQVRQTPTRWKDDQTELQREEIAKMEQQQQVQQVQARPNGMVFTKVIRWPPPQKA